MPTRSLLAIGVIFLAACTATESGSRTPGTPLPSASPSAAISPSTVASASAAASGTPTCVSSSDGPEVLCRLEAGTYRTVDFQPQLTYTVPSAGWGSLNRAAAPGNFHLFPPGALLSGFDQGTADDITVLTAVVAPGTCTGLPSATVAQTFDGLLQFLTTDPHVVVTNRHDASVGGWSGTVMDVAIADGDGCPDGVYADLMVGVSPSHGAFGTTPSLSSTRVYLLHNPGADTAFAILIDDAKNGGSDYGDGEDWFAPAQSVVDSFVIGP